MTPKSFRHIAKESLFVSLSISCMVVMIFITAIADADLDPSKIWTRDNWSNLLIGAAITVFGTIVSIPKGIIETKTRKNSDGSSGRYLQDFNEYHTIRQKIESKRYMFNQWHHAQYLAEHKSKRINYLLERNIFQADDILELSREQILALKKPQVYTVGGEQVLFKALTANQIAACLHVYDGKVTVHKLPDFYFLYIDGKSKRTFYDQAYYESRDEAYALISKLCYKLFLGFVITCTLTGLVFNMIEVEEYTTRYIMKLVFTIISRIFNVITSTLWGYLMGQEHVYQLCYYISGKTQFLKTFDSDNEFVYKPLRQVVTETPTRSLTENGESDVNSSENIDTPPTASVLE